jgi:hypothetical protein
MQIRQISKIAAKRTLSFNFFEYKNPIAGDLKIKFISRDDTPKITYRLWNRNLSFRENYRH